MTGQMLANVRIGLEGGAMEDNRRVKLTHATPKATHSLLIPMIRHPAVDSM